MHIIKGSRNVSFVFVYRPKKCNGRRTTAANLKIIRNMRASKCKSEQKNIAEWHLYWSFCSWQFSSSSLASKFKKKKKDYAGNKKRAQQVTVTKQH